jgi:signal transduction histidine kinase
MITESREEIVDEWQRVLAETGLPYQKHMARTNPERVGSGFDRIAGFAIAALSAPASPLGNEARDQLLALYQQYGRRWAQSEGAEPSMVAEPPRISQAIRCVLIKRYASEVRPEELLQVVLLLDTLSMDMALARVFGYMSYKEEVLTRQQHELSLLADELTHVEAQQRRAVALELHDSLAQQLVSVFSGIQHCERLIERDIDAARHELTRLRQIAQETIRDARGMIRDLHFGGTSQGGGIAGLSEYVSDLEADTGIRHTFRRLGPVAELAPTQEALVIRIIQEALINARKHAAPRRINIVIKYDAETLRVSVRDDGCGFDVHEARDRSRRRGRFGLIGMQERAQLLGALLTIVSAPGKGTTISLTMPREGSR